MMRSVMLAWAAFILLWVGTAIVLAVAVMATT